MMATGIASVTARALDQQEEAPLKSIALTLMQYPPGFDQLWDAEARSPESTRQVTEVVPSPQSKTYLILSPSGSVADVV